jgi:phage-related protein
MTPTIETLAELAAMFTNFLVQLDPGILKVITTALLSLWAGMSLPAVLAAAAIGAVVYLVQQHWDTIVEATRTVMDTLSGLLDWDAIVENVQGAMDRIGAALDWEAIGEDISNALDSVMDAVAEVGDALSDIWSNIPFKEQATDLFRWFVDTVPGWFGDAVARIQSYFKPIMAGLQDVADQIEPVWEALKRLTAIVIAVLSPIIGLVVAVGLAFANFAKKFVGPAVTMVGEMLGNLLSIVGNVIGFIANIIMFRWGDAWENVKAIVGNAIGVVSDVIGLWVHTIATLFSSMFETVTQIWGFLWERVQGVWDAFYAAVLEPIGGFISAIIGWFQLLYDVLVGNSIIPDLVNAIIGFFTTLWTTIETIVTTIKDIVVAVWEAIKLAVETVVGAIVLVVQTAWEGMKVVVETAVNAIKTVVETVWGAIKTAVQTAVDGIKTALGTAWDGIKTAAETAWDLVHDYIVDPLQEAWDWVKDTFSTIVETLGGLWDDIETAASTGWNLIKDAIIGPFEAAWEKVKEIAGWITDKVGWVIDMVGKLPFVGGGGIDFDAAKQAQEEGGFAKGGFGNFGAGTPTVLHGREVIIPVSSPGRAWELMQQSGLDRLAAAMSQGRGPTVSGPLVSMPGAIIQDATDAQVVAQQTAAALTALVAA